MYTVQSRQAHFTPQITLQLTWQDYLKISSHWLQINIICRSRPVGFVYSTSTKVLVPLTDSCLATVTTLGSRKWERAALASQAELLLSFSLTASLSSCNPGCLYVTTSPLCVSCPDVNKEELHTSHCTRKLEHSLTPGITKPRRRWLLSVCLAKILYLLHTEWIFSIHGFRKTEALWKLSNKSDIITLGLPVSNLGVQLTE